MLKEQDNIKAMFTEMKSKRSESESLWTDISNVCGITLDVQYFNSPQSHSPNDKRDKYVDDPTAALSVIQAGDYIDGIMWGTGENAVTLEPSDYVANKSEDAQTKKYFEWRTKQLLTNMNHGKAGFSTARKPYNYDQVAFGTSGIGVFLNDNFKRGTDFHPYIFRNFGVDNCCIEEGINGQVDIICIVYQWRVNRIVKEFNKVLNKLPKEILQSQKDGDYNKEYTLVQAIYPRDNFHPTRKGKLGTRYKGAWFLDDGASSGDIFFEEDFKTMPIGMCRAIKVRGEPYGRSSGSLLISSILSVNYMFAQGIENIEKKNNPALGTFSNAVFGDSVVDTSANGLVPFNADFSGKGSPLWKLYDEGDPTALISFLIPYLNEKIATGFKVDLLLDFATEAGATATEIMKRSVIRNKALSGLVGQQKNEMLEPVITRCIQIEDDNGLRGIDPRMDVQGLNEARRLGKDEIIIPDAVLEAMLAGRPWYKIRYNNELERLNKTEQLERIMQAMNGISILASMSPQILEAIPFYDMLKDINDALGLTYIKDEKEFKAIIAQQADIQQKAMLLQAGQAGADIQGKLSKANKDEADAKK